MLLLNSAILGLAAYEGMNLIKKGLKKELVIYLTLLVISIIVEIICIGTTGAKSLSSLILDLMGMKH